MRRLLVATLAVAAGVGFLTTGEESSAASAPTVATVIEGRDTGTNRVVLTLVGRGVSKFKSFDLTRVGGAALAAPELVMNSSTMLLVRLPDGVDLGTYNLTLHYGKSGVVTVPVAISAGAVPPGTLTPAAFTTSSLADFNDAATLGGIAPTFYARTSDVVPRVGGTMTGALTVDTSATNSITGQTSLATGRGVFGWATSGSGQAFGVQGQSDSSAGTGVFGIATATTGTNFGVFGQSASASGRGVYGVATSSSGSLAVGVQGETASSTGNGVYGLATSTTGQTAGVRGETLSTAGVGVAGFSTAASGSTFGVYGTAASATGRGVYGYESNTTGAVYGVHGETPSSSGAGVFGFATATSGFVSGVQGQTQSSSGVGVSGLSLASSGNSYGVQGSSASTTGSGVAGFATTTSGVTSGVRGESASGSAGAAGVFGRAGSVTGPVSGVYGESASSSGFGVFGLSTSTTGAASGISGQAASGSGFGVFGLATSTTGFATGVQGSSASPGGNGVLGTATAASGAAWGVWGDSTSSGGEGVHASVSGSGASATALVADHTGSSGNVAIFRSGGSNVARIDKTGRGYFNNGTQASGADFAESVAVNAPSRDFEPGDVLVIDTTGDRRFALAHDAESSLVAGVVSTKPAMLGSVHDVAGASPALAAEVPLGIVGIVPTKVCDEGGPVHRGDLLVTSSVPGHAMRAPASPKVGTVLGKALGELTSGRGVVEVLLVAR
jgi:hypothetical protein